MSPSQQFFFFECFPNENKIKVGKTERLSKNSHKLKNCKIFHLWVTKALVLYFVNQFSSEVGTPLLQNTNSVIKYLYCPIMNRICCYRSKIVHDPLCWKFSVCWHWHIWDVVRRRSLVNKSCLCHPQCPIINNWNSL